MNPDILDPEVRRAFENPEDYDWSGTPEEEIVKDYLRPSTVKVDAAGRELDAAGKLVVQTSRPDLAPTNGVDPDRKPEFKSGLARNGNS